MKKSLSLLMACFLFFGFAWVNPPVPGLTGNSLMEIVHLGHKFKLEIDRRCSKEALLLTP